MQSAPAGRRSHVRRPPVTPAPTICPSCRLGRLTSVSQLCPLCGRVGDRDSWRRCGAEAPPAIDQAVRRELEERFHVEELIGRGGMSLVYLAWERELGRRVALKVLPLQLIMGDEAIQRFQQEARIAASLEHRNIVQVFGTGATATLLWFSMRWVKGRSLWEILRERDALGLEECRRVISGVASGLYYAHRRGVVHRDVKPGNILIDETGRVCVCDFGVAKAFGAMQVTRTGATVGTPGYLPPEQCLGQRVDGAADQYSLAVVAFECLTGRLPFTADSFGEVVRKHCDEAPPRLSEMRPDLPAHVTEAVARALSKRPEDRFPDVAAFAEALGGRPHRHTSEPVELDVALAALSTPVPEPSTRARRAGGERRWVAATVGAVALAGGLAVAIPRNGAAPPPPMQEVQVTPVHRPGKLWIGSNPWGYLWIDGQRIGPTPVRDREIPAGRHAVRIERPGFEPYEEVIEVAPEQLVRRVDIELRPAGR